MLLFGSTLVFGQGGSLDATFNPGDTGLGNGDGANNTILASVVQPDGKILIGGSFTTWNGTTRNRIARLNADGTLDATFNPGTGANSNVRAIALQSDGKILIAGQFTTFNSLTVFRIIRLNADGSVDGTFSIAAGVDNQINALLLQSDGKIVIAGTFVNYNATTTNRIMRLNADGTADTGFAIGTGFNNQVLAAALQPDGKILAGGSFTSYNGTTRNRIIRLNTDGTNDATFAPGSGANNNVYAITVQSDNNILLGGQFTTYNGTAKNRITRITSAGAIDATYNVGTGADNIIYNIVQQPDGKVILSGNETSYNGNTHNNVFRTLSDGTYDAGFSSGVTTAAIVYTTPLLGSGKIFLGGAFTLYSTILRGRGQRINADGTLDLTFNSGSGANAGVFTSFAQPDGKIVFGGAFQLYNGQIRNYVGRANSNGSVDASFNPGSGANNSVNCVIRQPDGKILVGGAFTSFSATAAGGIIRLNADGSVDATFNAGTGANAAINTLCLQPDGKILAGGAFTTFNGAAANYIIRLNADGSTDAAFVSGTGFDAAVNSIAVQSDQRIVAGGNFTTYNGTAAGRILRLNTDGSIDASFTGAGADNSVMAVYVMTDGNIMVGGSFATYNGSAIVRVVRVLPDGSVDPAFQVGSGANSTVRGFAQQADGKVLLIGDFTSVNGSGKQRIARFLSTGQVDQVFASASGANNAVYTITMLPAGRVIIGGTFTSYHGTGRNRLAKVITCEQNLITHTVTACDSYTWINGVTYTASTNTPALYYTNVTGCDSNYYLNLTITHGTVQDNYITACNSYTLGGTTYSASGNYTQVLTSQAGCDSVIHLHLTISHSNTGSQFITACGSYNWPATGTAYTTSGTYTATLTNVSGCDSVATLHLTIHSPSTSTASITACNSYFWNASGQTYTTAGTYTATLTNQSGCDSVVTLNLTINDTVYGSAAIAGCGSVSLNGTTYTTGGTYTQWLTTSGGCDSMLTVTATVYGVPQVDSLQVTNALCFGEANGSAQVYYSGGSGPYTVSWSGGGAGNAVSGLTAGAYTTTITDANGCAVTQAFSVSEPSQVTANAAITSCEPVTLNGITYSATGSYQQTLTAQNGCDSTLMVEITIVSYPVASASDVGNGVLEAAPASAYQWINCADGSVLPNATGQTYTAIVNGSYAVIVSNGYCTDTSACVAVNYLALEETAEASVQLYPNPTVSDVRLEFSQNTGTLTIYDNAGKLMRRQEITSNEVISVIEFVPGVYQFSLQTAQGTIVKRLVKL